MFIHSLHCEFFIMLVLVGAGIRGLYVFFISNFQHRLMKMVEGGHEIIVNFPIYKTKIFSLNLKTLFTACGQFGVKLGNPIKLVLYCRNL